MFLYQSLTIQTGIVIRFPGFDPGGVVFCTEKRNTCISVQRYVVPYGIMLPQMLFFREIRRFSAQSRAALAQQVMHLNLLSPIILLRMLLFFFFHIPLYLFQLCPFWYKSFHHFFFNPVLFFSSF